MKVGKINFRKGRGKVLGKKQVLVPRRVTRGFGAPLLAFVFAVWEYRLLSTMAEIRLTEQRRRSVIQNLAFEYVGVCGVSFSSALVVSRFLVSLEPAGMAEAADFNEY
ncbi:hypothetical protein SU60_17660 [Vibrio mytili]|uniref:Uncharacterized protein n=1 Tax=Vibrio mytili TaxID=50718 RepID=A0A0C3E5X3_9VIBR|nr:hypothetical protein SU60_17660 [Vibrio mytili]